MEIVQGDLLSAEEEYIVQQTCCIACRPHGLSESIAIKWPYANPYAYTVPIKKGGNTATEESRYIPGTSKIFGSEGERKVACIFGQYAMGKPGRYNSFGVPDSAEDRLRYFVNGLDHFAATIPPNSTLALPYKIGCGLAGGNWIKYRACLESFLKKNPTLKMKIYSL